jgi:uncharacterized protein DUF4386
VIWGAAEMKERTTEASQRVAARVAGFALLLIIVSGVVGTFIGRDHIVISGDAAATAGNIMAHERRFRIGTACEIVMLNCDVVLALALYALLKPVNATLALLGAFWRLANAIVLGVSVAFSLAALDFLGGAHYLTVFKADQLQAQAKFFLDMHETGSLVGLIFFSLGAGIHSYLLLKSGYIPKILSGFYLFAVSWLLICCLGFIVVPDSMKVFDTAFIVPDFVAEVLVALWLIFKGANVQPSFYQS